MSAMPRTILGLFAHPDDEILGPGATLAGHAAAGDRVELLIATHGEAGEISDLALASPATLAQVRAAEMDCSAAALGVSAVHWLDYRDSGMAGTPDNDHPAAFCNAPADVVVPQLVRLIRRVCPDLVMTFEPYGGYGHPDHIAIHQHTLAAVDAAGDPAYRPDLGSVWATPRLVYPILPMSLFEEMQARLTAIGHPIEGWDERWEERREKGWPEEDIHCVVDVSETLDAKLASFLCHRTQFGNDNIFQRLPDAAMRELFGREYFAIIHPPAARGVRVDDLFAPLDT